MTFEETMHTISVLMSFPGIDSEELEPQIQELQAEYDRLLEENNQLKAKNAKLLQLKKANTPMYKGEYNND